MPENSFLDALRSAQERAGAAFDVADKSLRDAVTQVAAAVRDFTEGKLRVGLTTIEDKPDGRTYQFSLVTSQSSGYLIEGLHVPSKGYPITFGSIFDGQHYVASGSLADQAAVEDHFSKMLGDPNSRLGVLLAFEIRQARSK